MFPYVRFTQNRSLEEADAIFRQRIADALAIYERHHQDFRDRPCPFCGCEDRRELEPFHGTYGVARCLACASQYVTPCPTEQALADYYANCECNRMLDAVFQARARKQESFILDGRTATVLELLRSLPAEGPLDVLEAGCGSGGALYKLQQGIARDEELSQREIRLSGVDIDSHAIENPVAPGLQLTSMPVERLAERDSGQYDLILHYELVEHLPDPYGFMCTMHRLLRPGGAMFFTTPNAEGLEMLTGYNGYRLLAHAIFPPMHLNALSVRNIALFAQRCGFRLSWAETPGRLDVDMLAIAASHQDDPAFTALAGLDDEAKGLVQHLLGRLGASSHMQCVMTKQGAGAL